MGGGKGFIARTCKKSCRRGSCRRDVENSQADGKKLP